MTFSPETLLPPPVQPEPEYSKVLANPETVSLPSAEDKLSTSSKIPRPTPSNTDSSPPVPEVDGPPSFADVANPEIVSHTIVSQNGHEEASDSDGTVSDNPLQLNTDEFPTVQEASEKIAAQTKEHATENKQASSSHHPFNGILTRVASIPAISDTVSFVNQSVTNVVRKHRIVRLALNTTLRTVTLGVSITEKLASPVKPVLDIVDNQAVKVLDRVEKQFPIINRPTHDIVNTVSDMVTVTSDTAAHKVLEIRPIRSCVHLSATTLRTVNDSVDKVLHKAHIERADQHSTIYTSVESLTRHVLELVNETRDGDWRSKVEARRQSRCDLHTNSARSSSANLIATYHGSEIIAE